MLLQRGGTKTPCFSCIMAGEGLGSRKSRDIFMPCTPNVQKEGVLQSLAPLRPYWCNWCPRQSLAAVIQSWWLAPQPCVAWLPPIRQGNERSCVQFPAAGNFLALLPGWLGSDRSSQEPVLHGFTHGVRGGKGHSVQEVPRHIPKGKTFPAPIGRGERCQQSISTSDWWFCLKCSSFTKPSGFSSIACSSVAFYPRG